MVVLGLVALFFAGVFLASSIPHFTKDVTGQRHMTPLAHHFTGDVLQDTRRGLTPHHNL